MITKKYLYYIWFLIFCNRHWTKRQLTRILGKIVKHLGCFFWQLTSKIRNTSHILVIKINHLLTGTSFSFTGVTKINDNIFINHINCKTKTLLYTLWILNFLVKKKITRSCSTNKQPNINSQVQVYVNKIVNIMEALQVNYVLRPFEGNINNVEPQGVKTNSGNKRDRNIIL